MGEVSHVHIGKAFTLAHFLLGSQFVNPQKIQSGYVSTQDSLQGKRGVRLLSPSFSLTGLSLPLSFILSLTLLLTLSHSFSLSH
jgi:hypothetical protein